MWIITIVVILVLGSMAYAAVSGAPWVPTWKRDITRIINLGQPQKGEVFYELGCGTAGTVISVAEKSGAKGIGVELSFLQFLIAYIRAKLSRSNVSIKWKKLFKINLADADIIYLFLMPEAYEKLRAKLERELKPGTRVISYVWPIKGWDVVNVDKKSGKQALYLYVM